MVNMVGFNNFTEKLLWEYTVESRKQFLSSLEDYDIYCMNKDSQVHGGHQKLMVASLGEHLGVNIEDKTYYENTTNSNAELAFRLLMYLVHCPNKSFQSQWRLFFKGLFENSSLKNIVLELNRLIKLSLEKENENILNITRKLLNKVEQDIDLKYKSFKNIKFEGYI